MSIPDDTPAAVKILPRSTTRSATGTAPRRASESRAAQCVVASTPFNRPADASSSDPVQTEVVHCVCASTAAIQRG